MRLLFVIFLFFSKNTLADNSRFRYSFKSVNGLYELKPSDTIFSNKKIHIDSIYNQETKEYYTNEYTYSDRYIWSLYNTRTKEKLYTLENSKEHFIESKSVLISNNGNSVVIVDDYSGGYGFKDFDVVHFYKRDKLIKNLKLQDLLSNMCSVTYSSSHMRWCLTFNMSKSNTFRVKTNDFYNFEYDLNGNLIKKISDLRINKFEDIVYAEIKRVNRNKYRFKVLKSIRNKSITNNILFIDVKDKTMRKIFGMFSGILPNRNKKMESKFYRTMLFNNNYPIVSKIQFPNYNSNSICNLIK